MILSQPSDGDVDDISVNFRGVSLSKTSWTVQGLNLFINDSNLMNVQFFIRNKPICPICMKENRIVNSIFGHLSIKGGYNVHVSDCKVDGATVMPNSTLLDMMGGTLSVSNSSFQYLGESAGSVNVDPGLLRAVGCRIHMVGVNCSNNEVPGGLIQIQNGSELFVQNSTFINNGHVSSPSSVISVKFNSSLFISGSLFSGNVASDGSCLWLHHNISVTINQSTFENNIGIKGGVIFQYNAYSKNLSYKQNRLEHDFSAKGEIQESLSIYDSYFVNNTAEWGGVAYLYQGFIDLFVKKCNFTKNEAEYGGAVCMDSHTSTLVMQQCLFANNSARSSGSSINLWGTHSQLVDCEFLGDSFCKHLEFPCTTLEFSYCTSSIINCTFNEQADTSISMLGKKLNITDSSFYGCKRYCLYWDTSEIRIIRSQFAAYAEIVLKSTDQKQRSNLTVINTSFMNGHSVFETGKGSGQSQFINCSFYIRVGLVLIDQILLSNCIISNLKRKLHSGSTSQRIRFRRSHRFCSIRDSGLCYYWE